MRLPNADRATVRPEKLTAYLLVAEHPENKGKADFWFSQGFSVAQWEVLATALREHALTGEARVARQSPGGLLYTVEGEIDTPSGKRPYVRAIWEIKNDESEPRFISGYPG